MSGRLLLKNDRRIIFSFTLWFHHISRKQSTDQQPSYPSPKLWLKDSYEISSNHAFSCGPIARSKSYRQSEPERRVLRLLKWMFGWDVFLCCVLVVCTFQLCHSWATLYQSFMHMTAISHHLHIKKDVCLFIYSIFCWRPFCRTHTHNSIYIIHTNRYESVNIEQRQVICKEPSAKKTLHFVYTKDIRKITKQKQMLSTAVEIFTIAHTEEREKKTRKNTMTWSVCVWFKVWWNMEVLPRETKSFDWNTFTVEDFSSFLSFWLYCSCFCCFSATTDISALLIVIFSCILIPTLIHLADVKSNVNNAFEHKQNIPNRTKNPSKCLKLIKLSWIPNIRTDSYKAVPYE